MYRSRRLMGVWIHGHIMGIGCNISSNAYVLISCAQILFSTEHLECLYVFVNFNIDFWHESSRPVKIYNAQTNNYNY